VSSSTLLSDDEIGELGLGSHGTDIRIDRRAALFGVEHLHLGSHVRIDAFAVITAGPAEVRLGSHTHVSPHTYLSGAQGGITLGDGSGVAPFAALYSAVEDYSAGHLTNPMVDPDLRSTKVGPIVAQRHVAIGSSSVVLAGVNLGLGASIGALSLVNRSVRDLEIVHGNPIRRIGKRDAEKFGAFDEEFVRRLQLEPNDR
jgi:galactoside O-acetyltransferase